MIPLLARAVASRDDHVLAAAMSARFVLVGWLVAFCPSLHFLLSPDIYPV